VPFETINNNPDYIRYASFLRGANPLGAYLLIPFSVITVFLVRGRRDLRFVALWAATIAMLFFSYSRAAWLGGIVVFIVIIPLTGLRSPRVRRGLFLGLPLVIISLSVLAIALHHNARFQNTFLHTQNHSRVAATSDAGHASATKAGFLDLVHHPLGSGPGTAGPASVYNNHPARIAENYFIQVGQEVGWLGLAIFLLINCGVGYLLWVRRDDPLALALFASLLGLSIVNFLSHGWADDTLAYVWWGLAGIAVSIMPEAISVPEALLPVRKSRQKQTPRAAAKG
jgi:O-antigen ligase